MLAPHKRVTLACRPGTASKPTCSCTRAHAAPCFDVGYEQASAARRGPRASPGAPAPKTMKGFLMKGGHCGMSAITQPLPPSLAFTWRPPAQTAQPRITARRRAALTAAAAAAHASAGSWEQRPQPGPLAQQAAGRAAGHLQGDVGAVLRAPARRLARADAGLARHEALRGHAQERVARALDLGVQVHDCAGARGAQ